MTGIIGWKASFKKEGNTYLLGSAVHLIRKPHNPSQAQRSSCSIVSPIWLSGRWMCQGWGRAQWVLLTALPAMSCRWCSPDFEIRDPLLLADDAWKNFCLKVFSSTEAWSSIVPHVNFCPLLQAGDAVAPLVIPSRVVKFFCMSFMVQVTAVLKRSLLLVLWALVAILRQRWARHWVAGCKKSYIRAPFCWVCLASHL